MMERIEYLLRLVMAPTLGPVSIHGLLRRFGDAAAVLSASEAEWRDYGKLKPEQVKNLLSARDFDPRPEMDRAARSGTKILAYDDPDYPAPLRALHDPPVVLYCRGELLPRDTPAFGIVGTRYPSEYGKKQSRDFGSLLARRGFTVVSGLAVGVDTFAHHGALDAGGRTLAVLGSGLDRIYPDENRDLAAEIAAHGAVLSEFTMEREPSRETFPRRNRIIAALAWGTLVVEAPDRSGALITARYANELGREIFAVPGRIDSPLSVGCHKLIRDGATLVTGLDDIMAELPATPPSAPSAGPVRGMPKPAGADPDDRPAPRPAAAEKKTPPQPPATPAQPPLRPRPPGAAERLKALTAYPLPDAAPATTPPKASTRPSRSTKTLGKAAGKKAPPDEPEPSEPPRATPQPLQGGDAEKLLAVLGDEPATIDELSQQTDLPVETVSSTLLLMELVQQVTALPGKLYILKRL